MNQIRICLLLSRHKCYPADYMENEEWVLRAQEALAASWGLREARFNEPDAGFWWKLLDICWMMRKISITLGSHRKTLIRQSPVHLPAVTLVDIEEVGDQPWYLDAQYKRKHCLIFIACVDLFRAVELFCNSLLALDCASGLDNSGRTEPERRSTLAILEECDAKITAWRNMAHEHFDDSKLPLSRPQGQEFSLQAHRLWLRLTYEFVPPPSSRGSYQCQQLTLIRVCRFFLLIALSGSLLGSLSVPSISLASLAEGIRHPFMLLGFERHPGRSFGTLPKPLRRCLVNLLHGTLYDFFRSLRM
jgi:hypothetical protein